MLLISDVDAVHRDRDRFDGWRRKCRTVLDSIFGSNSSQSKDLMKIDYNFYGACNIGDNLPFIQAFNDGLEKSRQLLRAYIWELENLGMPVCQSTNPDQSAATANETTSDNAQRESATDVLISWSKKQSREMASVFHDWLPKVVPGLRPWMSSKDIDKGKQWFSELQDFLGEATSCVICVTSENVRSPWIYYETGAIAAKKQDVLVCPYLVGIGTSMIADGPLAQFQCTEATKEDTLALIRSLNKALANPHDEELLCGNFENKWPEFEQELTRILEMDVTAPADFVETEADGLAGYKLSAEARKVARHGSISGRWIRIVYSLFGGCGHQCWRGTYERS